MGCSEVPSVQGCDLCPGEMDTSEPVSSLPSSTMGPLPPAEGVTMSHPRRHLISEAQPPEL